MDNIYPSKLLLMSCLTQEQGFFFACLKDAAGAALKSAAPAPGSDQQKNRLRLHNTDRYSIANWNFSTENFKFELMNGKLIRLY